MFSPRIVPNLTPADAFEALRAGDDHRAIALAHNVDAPGFAALRARAYFRLGRYERVLAEYVRRNLTSYDAHEGIVLAGVAARAFLASGDDDRARDAFSRVRGLASRSSDALLGAYGASIECAIERDGDATILRRAIDSGLEAAARCRARANDRPHQLDAAIVRASLHAADAAYHARFGDDTAREAALLSAVFVQARSDRPDAALEADLLGEVASLVHGTCAPDLHRHLEARAASFAWSPHTDRIETRVRRALEHHARLFEGDADRGLSATRGAPTLVMRLGDCVDALFCEEWSDRELFVTELRFAITLAHDIDWNDVTAVELLDLATLAALVAPFDLVFARSAKSIVYRCIGRARASEPADYPQRAKQRLAFMDACLAKGAGACADAVHHFGRVAHGSPAGGDRSFAIVAGIERYATTSERRDLAIGAAFMRDFPRSAFSRRIAHAFEAVIDAAPEAFTFLGAYEGPAPVRTGRGSAAAALTPPGRADRTA